MGSKTKLFIPYDIIEDHIHCSICLSVIRGSVLTPCGHRYCTKCITEWVERNHICPCCNSPLRASQFYSDVQFDSCIDAILKERDKAEENYFDLMFESASKESEASRNESEMSPRESESLYGTDEPSAFKRVLKDHLKTSLISHQMYFKRLKEDCQRKISLLDSGISLDKVFLDESVSDRTAVKVVLQKNLEESERLAAEAYDRYLTDHLPILEELPVKISVYIADKDLRIPNVLLHPVDRLSCIKSVVEAAMKERGDEILSWNDDSGTRLLFSPLTKSSKYDLQKAFASIDTLDDVHHLSWDSQPFFQCHMRPGSEIVLNDVFQCQSGLPKRCYVNVFREQGSQPVDYFICEDCGFKWICKSCAQRCHTGHQVTLFVKNHTPTWACCYCPKKNTCIIKET